MTLAPIVLFTYARLDHTRRTIEALLCNLNVESHDLIVFSDGPRSSEDENAVNQVREYLSTVSGFRTVSIHNRHYNHGLSRSIISGVTEVLHSYERIIVLEDDMVTSRYFLTYMNQALDLFANDERIISIHGYVYPVLGNLPEAFFLLGADCWGWGTWRRGWALFNEDGRFLLAELKRRKLLYLFDFNNSYGFSKMLKNQISGLNDSWAIRWYASAFLLGKMTLYPGRSLVFNIGNDSTGIHCLTTKSFDSDLSEFEINLKNLDVKVSDYAFNKFVDFFRRSKGSWLSRIWSQAKGLFINRFYG